MKNLYRNDGAGTPETQNSSEQKGEIPLKEQVQRDINSLKSLSDVLGILNKAQENKEYADNLSQDQVHQIFNKITIAEQKYLTLLKDAPNMPVSMKTALQVLESQLQEMQNNKMQLASNAPLTAPPSGKAPPSGAIPPETTT